MKHRKMIGMAAGLIQVCSSPLWAGEFSLGVAAGGQSTLYHDVEDQNFVIPVLGYEGERFSYFLDTATFVLMQGESGESRWRMRAVATARIFDQPNLRAGLEDRHSTVDIGLDAGIQGKWGSLSLEVLADALGNHEGGEATISYEYEFAVTERLAITPSLGVSYYNEKLADYYFGVRPGEARDMRVQYQPGASGVATAGVTMTYGLTESWTLVGVVQHMSLGDELADSPLVAEESSTTAVIGALYRF
ncbi:MAG TPA: MipA/OmpV family protein [Steroidobacteraceae bacterium]|nr:MipA/OmpV family protein [Steroidobacteraceae bacterium]